MTIRLKNFGDRRSTLFLVADCKQRLKMRRLGFFMNNGEFNPAKACLLHRRLQFYLAEAEPFIGVEFARFFKAMFGQIKNRDADAGFEDAPRLGYSALGMQRVMQRLREEDEVDRSVFDRDLFHVADVVVEIL